MNGLNPGKLTVKKGLYTSTTKETLLEINGDQGNMWQEARIDIKLPILANFELYATMLLEI